MKITKQQINEAQSMWGKALVEIGSLKNQPDQCLKTATSHINQLYAFENNEILFKPTKASESPFRLSFEGTLSYFIGSNTNHTEDLGFALNPWTSVQFINHAYKIKDNSALVIGHYIFTDPKGDTVKVEYTFGYILINNQLKIELHHSSLPYQK